MRAGLLASVLAAAWGLLHASSSWALDAPPTIAQAATASSFLVDAIDLSVVGADDGGEPNLTYFWAVSAGPGPVSFIENGTNLAQNTTARIFKAGAYTFLVTVRDVSGNTVTSSVSFTASAAVTRIELTPSLATLAPGAAQDFLAVALDGFSDPVTPQPPFAWTSNGNGTLTQNHLIAGASVAGPFWVRATAGTDVGEAAVLVTPAVPPTVAQAASATALTARSMQVKVLGADDGGEGALRYYWASLAGPAPVTFAANGSNGAKDTVATFSRAGSYRLQATLVDANGAIAQSAVDLTVASALAQLTLAPAIAGVPPNGKVRFSAVALDDFGEAMATPTTVWAVSGGGSVSAGLFSAGATAGGPFTLTATSGGLQATAQVRVSAGTAPQWANLAAASPARLEAATTNLSALGRDDGGEAALTYRWVWLSGPAPVAFSINASNPAKQTVATFTRPGDYSLGVTATDATGLTAFSAVNVTVVPSFGMVTLNPPTANVPTGGVQPFEVRGVDQFGLSTQLPPSSVTWSLSGGGAVSPTGLFSAKLIPGGPYGVGASVGITGGTASVTIVADLPIIDTEAPVVRWTQPVAGAKLKLTPVMVVEATDNLGVVRVNFTVDGNPLGSLDLPPWELTLDTRLLRNGAHLLEVSAVDGAGNVGTATPVPVEVFNLAGPELGKVTGTTGCGTGAEPLACLVGLALLGLRRAQRPQK